MKALAEDLRAHRQSQRRGDWGYWTRERLLAAGHEFAQRYGRPPAAPDWEPSLAGADSREERRRRYATGYWPSLGAVQYRFGRWSDFLRAAGFPVPRGGPRGDKPRALTARQELVLDVVREWSCDDDVSITASELADAFIDCSEEFDGWPEGEWSRSTIHQILFRLERRGLVQRQVQPNGRIEWLPAERRAR